MKPAGIAALLVLALMCGACRGGDFNDIKNTETSETIKTTEATKTTETTEAAEMKDRTKRTGADETLIPPAADIADISNFGAVTGDEFLAALAGNDRVTGVWRLMDGITFGAEFSGRTPDLSGAVLIADTGTAVTIKADNFTLSALTVVGSRDTAISVEGKNVTITDCRIECEGGSAVADSSGGYLSVVNNVISGCTEAAIAVTSSYAVVSHNTVDSPAALSIAGEGTVNGLAASNRTGGTVVISGARNAVVCGNECGMISVADCTDLTVAHNTAPVELDGVTRALADGNIPGDIARIDCTDVYGRNIEGVLAARTYTGADMSRLPVVSLSRFDGMPARNSVRHNGKNVTADYYIKSLIDEGGEIIIPPGVYSLSNTVRIENRRDIDIYAYGVFFVFEDYTKQAIALSGSNNISISGLTIDFASVPNAQGTVISADGSHIVWKGDEGYGFDLTDPSRFAPTTAAEGFRQGSRTPYCDYYNLNLNTVKNADGTFTLGASAKPEPGDRLTFRGVFAHVIYASGCGGVSLTDLTLWGGSGFGFCEVNGEGNTKLSRVLMTPGPKPEGASEERLLSVCDATHCTNMRRGIQVFDCLFEYMTDDGTNVNGTYGLIESYDSNSRVVTYNADTTPEIRDGDRIWIMTLEGQFLLDTAAVGPGAGGRMTIADDLEMPGEAIFIENVSANGAGFLFESTVVRGNRSRGLLIKSTAGRISHCTIDSTGMTGILLKPEISDNWGECGYTENVIVEYNDIINTGYFDPGSDAQSAIAVRTDLAALDESYFSHRNINVTGNRIDAYWGGWAICLRGVAGVSVSGNILGARNGAINNDYPDDAKAPLYLSGCDGAFIDGNIFAGNPASKIRTAGKIYNLSGSDEPE